VHHSVAAVHILLLSVLLLSVPVSAQTSNGPDALAVQLLNLIRTQDFNGAAAMFHYPASQSKAEREADRAGVARWIRTLSQEVGPLQTFQTQRSSLRAETILTVSIAGGDVPYWASRGAMSTISHTFLASWKTERDTRLTVDIMKIGNAREIQSLHFGVPTRGQMQTPS
jgi:hypothetical protein